LLNSQAQEVTKVLEQLRADGVLTQEQFQTLYNALNYNWRQAIGDVVDAAVAAALAYFGLNKLPFLRRRETPPPTSPVVS
jgi:hypothetical protein